MIWTAVTQMKNLSVNRYVICYTHMFDSASLSAAGYRPRHLRYLPHGFMLIGVKSAASQETPP